MARSVAMETILGFTTAASTTFTAVTVGTNQSLTIRDSGQGNQWPRIVDLFSNFQGTSGIIRIRAASFPENQIGIYTRPTAAVRRPMLPNFPRLVKPQDTLDWMQQGSATGGDIDQAFVTVFYPNSPTIPAIALNKAELMQYGVGEVNAENTITTGTDGQWATGENFHAEQNPFLPDTWYALVGNVNQAAVGAVSYQAAGFGNLRIAVPGDVDARITRNYFVDLSERSGLPTIFCFKSSSLGTTVISAAVDENGADPIVNSYYVQLAPDFDPAKLQ